MTAAAGMRGRAVIVMIGVPGVRMVVLCVCHETLPDRISGLLNNIP